MVRLVPVDDPLKVFLGSLNPSINKPKLLSWLEFFELDTHAVDVFVPECRGQLAVAFVTFDDPVASNHAVNCFNGLLAPDITPKHVKAQMVAIMGVFISFSKSVFSFLGL